MTKAQIISDVILQLTQANPSDDLSLDDAQVAAWLTYVANLLVAAEINSKLALNEMVPSIYITREECVLGETEDTDCGGDCQDRIAIELDNEVMTLNNDGGIVMVQTEDGDQVLKAGSINNIILFRNMRFSKPSGENFVYYRQGNKIYIEGMKFNDIPFDKFHVWYVKKQNYMTASDSTEVVVSDLVLPSLISAIVQLGKMELYGTQVDVANDGVDKKDTVYHTAIQNPENSTPE